jgi:type VI secretion system secreted protein VgrG
LADALGATAKVQNANQPETGKSNQTITLDSQGGAIKANGHLHHLKEATANLERATNTDPGAKGGQGDQAGQQPLLLMFGQSGLAITTPHSATLTSGSNLDQIALRDIQQSSGKRWLHNTGESISLFVTGAANSLSETFKILAAKGDVQMQAQSGDMEITADKQIRLHAIRQNQAWAAQKNILITCGGAYIKLEGGNIELHCPGTLTFRGNQHGVTGPASLRAELPALPSTAFRGWMDLDLDGFEGAPIKNVPYDPQRVNAEEFTGGVDNLLQQESAQYAATDSHGGED